jgi:hypothetical protein
MKNKFIIFIFIMFPAVLCAQESSNKLPFMFGPVAGLNISRYDTKVSDEQISNFKSRDRVGFHAGFFARMYYKRLYFQPEIICYMKGGRGIYDLAGIDTLGAATSFGYKQKLNVMSVDLPLLIGYTLGETLRNFRVFAGPVIGYTMTKKLLVETDGPALQESQRMNIKDATWSFTCGLGFDVSMFALDVRYERGLHDISWNPRFKQTPSSFMFTVAWKTF